ncbi:hypothetical protein ABIB25_000929 [Nakamurella sp. UYEF19]|uniref:class F sortase n=1 Tax=Nakamurella sp. UYEF19 TaxID=1756392 RepID=UPI00339B7A9E
MSKPTASELAVFGDLIHGRDNQVADSAAGQRSETTSPPSESPGAAAEPVGKAAEPVERKAPTRGSHRRPPRIRGGRLWLLGLVGLVLIAVTIWSIGQISTGISETPRDAPLPAAQFNQPNIGTAGAAGTAGNAPTATGEHRTAAPGIGIESGAAGKGTSTTTADPSTTNPDGGAIAAPVAVGPRPQTSTGPAAADELAIPALNVTAPVVNVDLITSSTPCTGSSDPIGNLCVPEQVSTVGQWTGSAPLSGTTGSILIDGHIDNIDQGPGALHDLYQVQAGDLVYLTRGGVLTRWKVTALQVFGKDANHPDWFAGSTGARELHLVTCGGPLITEPNGSHSYADNVAVTAIPA